MKRCIGWIILTFRQMRRKIRLEPEEKVSLIIGAIVGVIVATLMLIFFYMEPKTIFWLKALAKSLRYGIWLGVMTHVFIMTGLMVKEMIQETTKKPR